MGAGQSISSTLSRQKVYELTRDTRGLMDVLLDYMLKEITVRDFLALSNPSECKKYVIFLANNLYKHFYELEITPIKDKKGVIAFRPVKDLVNPSGNSENEKQSLCLTLAYFYTRIFQIYGALALTVLDDAKVMSDSGILTSYGESKKGLLAPGYRSYTSSGGTSPPAGALGNFNFMRAFITDEKDSQKGYLTLYSGEDNSRGQIFFYPKIDDRDEFGRPITTTLTETKIQKGIFFIGYIGGKLYSQLEVYSKIEGIGGDTKFTFGKFKFYKKEGLNPELIELTNDILPQKTITISRIRTTTTKVYIYSIRGSTKTVSEFLNDSLSNVVKYIRNNTIRNESITSSYGTVSETGTIEELRLAKTIQNLTRTKPLAHCLARAMQLLQTVPLKDEPAVSYICKAKFLEHTTITSSGTKTIQSRSGIPAPGASLDTSPGMAALSQLFYDTILTGTPRVVIGQERGPQGQPSSFEQYIQFMKVMGYRFGDTTFETNPENIKNETIKYGLKGIINNRDKQLCKDIPEKLYIPSNQINSVYQYVNRLFQIQVKHAAECGKIIKLLFNIQHDKDSTRYRISLSDNIIKKGFSEIQRINYLSRQLLVNYYSNCESIYVEGMKKVLTTSPQSIPIIKSRLNPASTT
jgi:hypothetical protein